MTKENIMNASYKRYLDELTHAYIDSHSYDDAGNAKVSDFVSWIESYDPEHVWGLPQIKEPTPYQFAESADVYITESFDIESLNSMLSTYLEGEDLNDHTAEELLAFVATRCCVDTRTLTNSIMYEWQKGRGDDLEWVEPSTSDALVDAFQHLYDLPLSSLLEAFAAYCDQQAQGRRQQGSAPRHGM